MGTHADSNSDADIHIYSDTETYIDTHSDTYIDIYSDTDTYSDADTDTDTRFDIPTTVSGVR